MFTDAQILEFYANRFHKTQMNAWELFYKYQFLIIKAGRRWGKSYFCSEMIIDFGFLEDPDYPPSMGMSFIAKTKDQAREILWETFKMRLRVRGVDKIVKTDEQKLEARFPTGVKLSIEGADVEEDRLRGTGKRLVVCDEFSFWKKNKYLWQEVLRPMLISPIGKKPGKGIVCTTPLTAENYFEDLFERGRINDSGYVSLHYTTHDNPLLSKKELADLAIEYGGVHTDEYKREILAITTRTSDLVFRDFRDEEPLTLESRDCPYFEAKTGKNYFPLGFYAFGGVDFGNKDPTVFLMCLYDWERDHLWVIDEHYKSQDLIKNHAQAFKEKMAERTDTIIVGDHDAQERMEYHYHGVSIMPADKAIAVGLNRINHRIQTKKITILKDKCPNLVRELLMLAWDEKKDKPAPNQSDHATDALRYVVRTINMGDYQHEAKETLEERIERRVIQKLKDREEHKELYGD